MKRLIKRIELSNKELDQLNAFEQRSILGGFYGDDSNINRAGGCTCTHSSNESKISNNNSAQNCACVCPK